LINYTLDVAVPSVTINLLNRMGKLPYDYYTYLWEAEADALGGVTSRDIGKVLPEDADTSFGGLLKLFLTDD